MEVKRKGLIGKAKLTIAVSSGVCCASSLLTTVDAADFTYDGF
jgi:hypothetical protein